MVLQLSRELRRLGRGRVVSLANEAWTCARALQETQGRAPCQRSLAALEAGSGGGALDARSVVCCAAAQKTQVQSAACYLPLFSAYPKVAIFIIPGHIQHSIHVVSLHP